ncbi:MAG: XRE family transcriptional regulator [Bergeyella cardium]|nr:MAG TPA: histidine kinase-like protein [Caudoviricetes sp.]
MKKQETLAERLKKRHPSLADIARKHHTNDAYVWQIAHGLRNPIRGKGLKIKQELEQLVK